MHEARDFRQGPESGCLGGLGPERAPGGAICWPGAVNTRPGRSATTRASGPSCSYAVTRICGPGRRCAVSPTAAPKVQEWPAACPGCGCGGDSWVEAQHPEARNGAKFCVAYCMECHVRQHTAVPPAAHKLVGTIGVNLKWPIAHLEATEATFEAPGEKVSGANGAMCVAGAHTGSVPLSVVPDRDFSVPRSPTCRGCAHRASHVQAVGAASTDTGPKARSSTRRSG